VKKGKDEGFSFQSYKYSSSNHCIEKYAVHQSSIHSNCYKNQNEKNKKLINQVGKTTSLSSILEKTLKDIAVVVMIVV